MKVFITILLLSTFFFGCRKPDSKPELQDPIYLDLQKRLSEFEKQLKFTNEERARLKQFIETTDAQDPTLRNKRKTYYLNETSREKAIQQVDYAKIALEKRKKEVRIRYLKAFKENKEDSWQNEAEIRAYKSRMENNDFLKVTD